MQKILLASTSEQENLILQRKLEPIAKTAGGLSFSTVRPQGVLSAIKEGYNLLILNVPEYTPEQRSIIITLRNQGHTTPLLLCAKTSSLEALREINNIPGMAFLEKPYEIKDLTGVVAKLLRTRSVAQRVFRRYYTMQTAEVQITATQRKTSSTLYNLSKGGAYVEFSKTEALKIGDQLTLHVPLKQMRRTYEMPARVVWTTPIGTGGGYGVGVQFLGAGGVHRNIFGSLE